MQGDKSVIDMLNDVLTNELTAVNQYFLHARMIGNWGFKALEEVVYKESIEEMRHADKLIERVLFLEGLPNLQDLHKLAIGETVPEALENDLGVELRGRKTLVDGIKLCEQREDFASRHILTEILSDTEEHIDYLETQLEVIKSVGLENYLQSMMGSPEN